MFEKLVSTFPVQDSGQADKGGKGSSEFLIAGGDAAVALDGAKEVLDAVALAVEAPMKVAAAEPLSVHGKAWEDVNRFRQAGGRPDPQFLKDLRKASGRQR